MPTRREFIAGGLALAATACTSGRHIGPTPPPGPHPSIRELTSGAPQLSILGLGPGALGGDVSEPIQTGTTLVTFDLGLNAQIIEGGSPQLYLATSETATERGPFGSVWPLFTGYQKTHDRSPRSPIPGVYVARIRVPKPGLYTVAGVGPGGRAQGVGITHV